MGQLLFVAGDAAVDGNATFVSNMLESPTDYVDYGFLTTGGDVFFSEDPFSVLLAFRVMQEDAVANISLLTCISNGHGYVFGIDASSLPYASVSGSPITPDVADLPLGRVILMCLTYDGTDTSNLYIQGRSMGSVTQVMGAPDANVIFAVGGGGTWTNDSIEYLGHAFIESELTAIEAAEIYVATQDACKLAIPASILVEENYSIYNASSGLSDITLWVPEANTMSAPDLPQAVTGTCESALKRVPMHMAHSGWSGVTPG